LSTAAPPTSDKARRGPQVSHGTGFWLIALAFTCVMAFSTVPAPLYVLYERKDGFGSFTVTIVFAVYAVGVVASLFLAGHVSDWLGRRPILVAAVLIEALAAVLFLCSPALPVLLIARFISGIGVGMITATATAHIGELHGAARPGTGRTRSDLVSTAANIGGLAFGPLISGILAQWAPSPLRTPYVVFLIVLLLAALVASTAPETVAIEHRRYRPQRVSVPSAARAHYYAVTAAGFIAFAVFGLFTSLAPTFVAVTMHHPARILAGVVTFVVFGAAAATQMALGRLPARTQLQIGLSAMGLGLIPLTIAVWIPSLALFLAGGVIAGAGAGVLFKGAISSVVALADPATRGEALAGFFLGSYLGLAGPVLGLGIATRYVSGETALTWFAGVLLILTAVIAPRVTRR
jgi:MFS family permease